MSDKPILVTGAAGRTGLRIIKALIARGVRVRAFVRRPAAGEELRTLGVGQVVVGDLLDAGSVAGAMRGAGQVLHICPPMHSQEDAIGRGIVAEAAAADVERFVLYSVLHPLLADVPHHARKLEAERALVGSGLAYTILQPSRYMQQLAPIWQSVLASGVHSMPFATSARFSVVDLDDLAQAAALVLTQPGHEGATYELAGPEALSQDDMARILTELLARPIRAEAKPLDRMRSEAAAAGIPAERIETMGRMNAHYDKHGLIGNPNVLHWLLGRAPTRFRDFVRRELLAS